MLSHILRRRLPIGGRGLYFSRVSCHQIELNPKPSNTFSFVIVCSSVKTNYVRQFSSSSSFNDGVPETRNLYEILGVERDASGADIKRAFKAKAKVTHPDTFARNGNGNGSKEKDAGGGIN